MPNTKAKFSTKTKREVLERDKTCIICGKQWEDVHHVLFGLDAEYWPDRNNSDKWVLLCRVDHMNAHACHRWEWVRQRCIDYLNNLK